MVKKISFRNVLSKRALSAVAALAISGIMPASIALAGELTISELVSETSNVTLAQGESKTFDIKLAVDGKFTDATVKVPTVYNIDANGKVTTSNLSQPVTFTYNGDKNNYSSTVSATVNVASNLQPGTYNFTIPKSSVLISNSNQTEAKLDNDKDDILTFVVTKSEVVPPQDLTAPIITLNHEISGIFNENTLPKKFEFNLDEKSEVFVNGKSQGVLESGSHELALPPSIEGNNSVTIIAKDAAGNQSTPVSFSYFYDTIKPLVTATADRDANNKGWYNSDVLVSFTATDVNGSGVASVNQAKTVSTEGNDQFITGKATDNAGNEGSGSITLNIDKTAPTINGSTDRKANSNDWYNNDVTVSFNANDSLSGVANVTGPVTLGEGANQSVEGTATDNADNSSSIAVSHINIDKTLPTIKRSVDSQANSNGWYNHDVTVSFEGTDELSGIDTTTSPIVLSENGANQSANGTTIDKAGNQQSTTVEGINIDKNSPEITVEDGKKYTLNQSVTWTAKDDLSGLDTSASGSIDTSKVGSKTQTITATDKAGNTTTKEIHYQVVYTYSGVLQPINSDGKSIFKAGSTVPVKFQLTDSNGNFISTANATIYYEKYSTQILGNDVEAVSTSAATSGNQFRYDPSASQYIFNLSTKGLDIGTYQITIKLDDGTSHTVNISLK